VTAAGKNFAFKIAAKPLQLEIQLLLAAYIGTRYRSIQRYHCQRLIYDIRFSHNTSVTVRETNDTSCHRCSTIEHSCNASKTVGVAVVVAAGLAGSSRHWKASTWPHQQQSGRPGQSARRTARQPTNFDETCRRRTGPSQEDRNHRDGDTTHPPAAVRTARFVRRYSIDIPRPS